MKNNIDKLTDTEILELAGYTKHIHSLIFDYNLYVNNLVGQTKVRSMSNKMSSLKSDLHDLLHEGATEVIKRNRTIDSMDLFYGNYNKKDCIIEDFIKGSKQSHAGLPDFTNTDCNFEKLFHEITKTKRPG